MSEFSQTSGQYIVSSNPVVNPSQLSGRVELFNEDGTPFPTVQKAVSRISPDWLMSALVPNEGPRPPCLGLLPVSPGRAYTVISASVRLNYNSVPYAGGDEGVNLYLSYLAEGADSETLFQINTLPDFWHSTADCVNVFRDQLPRNDHNLVGLGVYFYGDSFNSPLRGGDSDLALSLYYVTDEGVPA